MAYRDSFSSPFGMMLTLWVRRLLIANAAMFVLVFILGRIGPGLPGYLAFNPATVLLQPWSLVTYMFVHQGFFHLLFNMLILFFFGPVLEDRWGSRQFIRFYLLCGLAAAAIYIVWGLLAAAFGLGFPRYAIVGASGAVYGLLVAFAVYWPDSPIYIWGIFPVKAKYLVGGLIGLSVFFTLSGGRSGVADLAHLGGAIAAFAYIKSPWGPSEFGNVYTSRKKSRSWREYLPHRRAKPEPARPIVTPPRARPAARQPRRDDDVDRILDKISAGGIGSLTPEERQRLEEASRRRGTN